VNSGEVPTQHSNLVHGSWVDRLQRRLYFFSRRAHITAPFSQVGVSVSIGRNQYIGGYQGLQLLIDHVSLAGRRSAALIHR
jgi:hypothetical protein